MWATSFERELAWAATAFALASAELTDFVDLKHRLEKSLLIGDYQDSENLLDHIEAQFGFSIFLLEMRIAVLQTSQGLEAQKAYCATVRTLRPERDFLSFIGSFISWRNEETTNPFQYKKTVVERIADWTIPDHQRTYLRYKMAGHFDTNESTISTILRYEASFSLIDWYETFMRTAAVFLASRASPHAGLASALEPLRGKIPDLRIAKLTSLADNSGFESLRVCRRRQLDGDECLINGDYELLSEAAASDMAQNPDDIRALHNLAIASLESARDVPTIPGLGGKFVSLAKAVIEKKSALEESTLEGARLVLNYPYLSSAAQFESLFLPQISSNPRPAPAEQLAAFLTSPFIDPCIIRFLPEERRAQYIGLLKELYGAHPVVERWSKRSLSNMPPTVAATMRCLILRANLNHGPDPGIDESLKDGLQNTSSRQATFRKLSITSAGYVYLTVTRLS
jgi:hypothetical protein